MPCDPVAASGLLSPTHCPPPSGQAGPGWAGPGLPPAHWGVRGPAAPCTCRPFLLPALLLTNLHQKCICKVQPPEPPETCCFLPGLNSKQTNFPASPMQPRFEPFPGKESLFWSRVSSLWLLPRHSVIPSSKGLTKGTCTLRKSCEKEPLASCTSVFRNVAPCMCQDVVPSPWV